MFRNAAKGLLLIMCMMLVLSFTTVKADPDVKVKRIALEKYDKKVTIEKGEKVTLKVKVKPKNATNKKLKFKSSNKKIVSVSKKGVIKGKKNGKATITISAKDGSKKKVKLEVTVGVKVTGVTFTNADRFDERGVGAVDDLFAEVTPVNASNKKLVWKSSNEKVATVNQDGEVTMVSNGTATITATSTDGTKKKASKKIKVVTYVKSFTYDVTANAYVSRVNSSGVSVQKGRSFKINTTVNPPNATNKKYTWTSSNPEVASVDANGNVNAYQTGVVELTIQAKDKKAKSDTFRVYVNKLTTKDCVFIGHRGRSESAPENSYAAIKLALDGKFSGAEIDIWKTKDDQFVLSHDNSLERMCNVNFNITDLTYSLVTKTKIVNGNGIDKYSNEYVPSLESILILMENYPNKELLIEVKQQLSKEMIEKLLTMIKAHGLSDNVRIISFYSDNFKYIREATELGGDQIKLVFLESVSTSRCLPVCQKFGADYGVKYDGVAEKYVEQLHENGISVDVWGSPNFITSYTLVHSIGVDIVTTDYQFCE